MAERHPHDHAAAEGLVPLDEARERVLSRIETLRPLQLPLTDAFGCVAAEDIFSAVDLPEFASSGMDGFALRASDVAEASATDPAELKVVGHAMIGQRPEATVGMGEAVAIATGELIPPTDSPTFGQVRDSNAYTLFAALREAGAIPVLAGIVRDDPESLKEAVFNFEIQADGFVSSGGVSVGERDVVKAAFFRRGDIDFYRVAMQPGMPQGFGFIEGKPFFGLPGNPVSVFVSFEMFVRPAILKMMGRAQLERPEITATLTGEISGPKDKSVLARVVVARGPDGWTADPTGGRGSNLIATVARANGLALLAPGVDRAGPGERVRVRLFRSSED